MKSYFSFNPDIYSFWPIYETILKYYPVGIEADSFYCSTKYPGFKDMQKIIIENIHDEERFKKIWTSFEAQLQEELNRVVVGTTYGQSPSFSCEIIVEKFENEKVSYHKKLCIAISLIGPFYTIYGLDITAIKDMENGRYIYETINAITVSPFMEFEDVFTRIENKIKNTFEGYKLVPFWISLKYIRGLQMDTQGYSEYTVFQSLFTNQLHNYWGDQTGCLRGDDGYGSKNWIIAGVQIGGWTAYPPSLTDQ